MTRNGEILYLYFWQKTFGVAGLVLAVFIVMNPEFLAFGFLGDAAFFDALVLALSLQLHGSVFALFRRLKAAFRGIGMFAVRGVRRDLAMIAVCRDSYAATISSTFRMALKRINRKAGII